jgi:hypothetical protein
MVDRVLLDLGAQLKMILLDLSCMLFYVFFDLNFLDHVLFVLRLFLRCDLCKMTVAACKFRFPS